MLDRTATAWLRRLLTWLEPFEDCFGRQSQRGALRRYVSGLLNDSRRKSMEAMWARLSDPGTYQAFQHFITHAPWQADVLWKRLRAVVPERRGVLILDGTSFPKQGTASVGVARQYCGALGKLAKCQTAVTVALWTGARAWLLGATLYLPDAWLTPRQRERARIPSTTVFQPKWQLALTLWRQVRAAGFDITAVVGDAEFGDNATLRRTLHWAKLPYALGVSSDLKVFVGTPTLTAPSPLTGKGRPRTRQQLSADTHTIEARAWAATQASRRWRLVSWRNGTNPPWRARFCATRVTPAHDWRERRLAHQRWAIEQQYQELKDEIGLDHFEGRTLPGWQRHVVLTAIAYSFLQRERSRRGQTQLTLPRVRAVITEVLTAHFFITQPHYLKWMLKLKDVELRI